jgi:enoyl-[acyl-carrier-protein] reductase (NADH)
MRRLVTADDVAKATVFLASDDAAAITGVDLNVTTGMVMY